MFLLCRIVLAKTGSHFSHNALIACPQHRTAQPPRHSVSCAQILLFWAQETGFFRLQWLSNSGL